MMILEVLLGTVAILILLFRKLNKNKNHWDSRNVPNTGFKFLWGDDKGMLLQTRALQDICLDQYKKFDGEPFYGSWGLFGQPFLVLRNDFDLIRAVWIKDFDHFTIAAGETSFNIQPINRSEKMAISHVANLSGEEWKNVRYTCDDCI